jgi:FkbM family methyltransferase
MSLFSRRRPHALDGRKNRLTDEHIRWAYRLFLDREPETQAIVQQTRSSITSTEFLRQHFMTSLEFRTKNPGLGFTPERSVVITELSPGVRLFVDLSDAEIGLNIARRQYETAEMDFVRSVVGSGDRVLDIGANVGFFAIQMAAIVGAGGHVFAFEPVDQNADLLQRSIEENRFQDRITLRRVVVGDSPGTASMVFLPLEAGALNSGGGYVSPPDEPVPESHRKIERPRVSLDSEALEPIDFVKIDVEGSEPLVFRGATRLLTRDRPTIVCEINPRQLAAVAGCRPDDFITEMQNLGYQSFRLGSAASLWPLGPLRDDEVVSVVFRHRDRI